MTTTTITGLLGEEFKVTDDGCTVGRRSDGEFEGIYWQNEPAGEGWEYMGAAAPGFRGHPRSLWWRAIPPDPGPRE